MFDVDEFLGECRDAVTADHPQLAIRDALHRALSSPSAVAEALPPQRAAIERPHVSPELTVLKVVWAPHMVLWPHDHNMWAAIGIYTGGEDNAFFRRDGDTVAESGGKELRIGDVALLGDDTIHSVTNPTQQFTGAIHDYGGDFFTQPRSEWRPPEYREAPNDIERLRAFFDESNATPAATGDDTSP